MKTQEELIALIEKAAAELIAKELQYITKLNTEALQEPAPNRVSALYQNHTEKHIWGSRGKIAGILYLVGAIKEITNQQK